jgi:D-glycero-alpha-D-manno-heptose-7-phosphate kinase
MAELIKSRTPLRISFVGGGTDVSPFPEKYGGMVVNATITKYVTSTLRFRNDKKLKIEIVGEGKIIYPDIKKIKYDGKFDLVKATIKHLYSGKRGLDIYIYKEVAPRSGLGGSATLFVNIIGLFNELLKKKLDKYKIAELAYKLEREELKNLGGRQDQYAAVFGGINFIEFKGKNFVRVTPLNIAKETIYSLEENLILLDIGKRKNSGQIIEEQIKNVETKKSTLEAMLKTKEMVGELKEALLSNDLKRFGILLDKAWQLKKKFSSKISRPDIDKLYEDLKKAGAIGGKISGAGGGGHMVVFCRPFKRDKVEKAALKWGAKLVSFKLENSGLVTWREHF